MVRGKAVWLYRDACEKPFGDNLQLGGWAWPQTSLFTVPLHAAALPFLAALTLLPFREEEQPSPQPKYSSGRGHFDVGSSYMHATWYMQLQFLALTLPQPQKDALGLEDVAKQSHSVSSAVPEKAHSLDFLPQKVFSNRAFFHKDAAV